MECGFVPAGYVALVKCVRDLAHRLEPGTINEWLEAFNERDRVMPVPDELDEAEDSEEDSEQDDQSTPQAVAELTPEQAAVVARVQKAEAAYALVWKRAREHLRQVFGDGVVQTSCLRSSDGEIEPIPFALWWTNIALTALRSGCWPSCSGNRAGIGSGTVLVREADLDTILSPSKPKTGTNPAPPASRSDGTGGPRHRWLFAWMLGYLWAFKEIGKGLAKRDIAIKACCEANGCTYREAEDAFQAAPFPDLRHPPPDKRGKTGAGS